MSRGVTVQELAPKLNRTPADLVRILFEAGEMVTATVSLADEMIELIAETLGAQVLLVEPGSEQEVEFLAMLSDDYDEDDALLEPRAPVVTVLGHVDHGKTTLLDTIRNANVVAGEAGGITQSIGAYRVLRHTDEGDRFITFIDTPGHEAFTAMRRRGAQATDIAILVVAADDGVMPQTVEAISHARAAEVPIVVAVTKVDRDNADPTRVRQQLTENELVPEEWGGDTIVVDVSAPTGQGVDELLEQIMNVADIELADELVANPKKPAVAAVLEAHLDQGRGPVVSVLVEEGTLRVGDTIVAGGGMGPCPGHVRRVGPGRDRSRAVGAGRGARSRRRADGRRRSACRPQRQDRPHRRRGPCPPAQGGGVAQPADARRVAHASKTCSRRCSAARSQRSTSS